MEAIRLNREGWSHKQIAEHLDVHDKDCVKIGVRKYREQGSNGLMDCRGNPS
ncbi:helix-turn-helix domain-containing protein [Paenibacillus pasadenensis]|nr:helix-turn-helix domain-containing protein [Paenibacillus pasadenensis]